MFLLHSHPNDEKEGLFHRNHSVTSLGSFRNHNHMPDTALPLVSEDHTERRGSKAPDHDKEVFVSLFVSGLAVCAVFYVLHRGSELQRVNAGSVE